MLRRFAAFRLYKNRALRALLIVDGLVLAAVAMLAPIYAVFVDEVGGDLLDAGLTAGALAFGSGVASLISGKIADKTKNKRVFIFVAYAVTGLGFLLFTTIHSVWYLAAVQAVIGLAQAFGQPAYDALYSVHLEDGREAEGWGAWEAVSYFTTAFGALLGGFIVSVTSFSTLFVIMAALCGFSAIYITRVPHRTL